MIKVNNKISYLEMIIDLATVAFFTIRYILPSFDLNFLIPLALALVYGFYLFIKEPILRAPIILSFTLIVFLAFAYTMLTDTKTISSAVEYAELKQFFSKLNQYVMMFFPLLLAYRVINTHSLKIKLFVILAVSTVFLYVFGLTFIEIFRNPGAVRHWGDFSDLDSLNIGSYDFVYAIPIAVCVLATLNRRSNTKGKIISLLAIAVSFVFLIFADYTLAILIAIIGVIIVAYYSLDKTLSKLKFVIIVAISLLFLPVFLKLIYTYLPEGDMSIRTKEIYDFLLSGNADGYNLNSRLTLYANSIIAFLRNPIAGNQSLDFDGHGTFLSILSDTGLIGSLTMFAILFFARIFVGKMLGKHNKMFSPMFLSYILIGIVNPIHGAYALSFTMWFISPVVIDYFINKENV